MFICITFMRENQILCWDSRLSCKSMLSFESVLLVSSILSLARVIVSGIKSTGSPKVSVS